MIFVNNWIGYNIIVQEKGGNINVWQLFLSNKWECTTKFSTAKNEQFAEPIQPDVSTTGNDATASTTTNANDKGQACI